MLSLGYSDDELILKSDIAVVQLTDAITLFTKEHFISALTLAGAADGVLSGLLRARGEKCAAETSVDLYKMFRERLGLDVAIDKKPKREFFNEWNRDRNRVKHHDKEEDERVEINPCDAAYWMLRRAFWNAKNLGIEVPLRHEFDNWVVENVNL